MISVIIPTHKRADIISRAINCVLNQTYKNIELIVVSDGYDVETDKKMELYTDTKKVKYYSYPENKGGNYARNFGIRKSVGEYIAFLDDDDLWEKTKLEKQVEILKKNKNIGLVYTGKKTIYSDLEISYYNLPIEVGDLSEKIFYQNYIGSTSNVMVRRSILKDVGGFNERLHAMQDRELWMRICQITEIDAVKEPLFMHMNEASTNQISVNIEKRLNALEIILEEHNNIFKVKPNLRHAFEKGTYESIIRIAQRNQDFDSIKKYAKLYFNKFSSINSLLFLLSATIPYELALKTRSYIDRLK